jgi:aminopeptidase N
MACGERPAPASLPEVVEHWQVDLYAHTLELAKGQLTSTLSLTLEPPGGRCVELPSRLPVSAARWDGQAATTQHDGGMLRVCGAGSEGGAVSLHVEVQLERAREAGSGVGFWQSTDASGAQFSWLNGWLRGCSRFGPCDDAVSGQAEWDVTVVHGESEVVLCAGERVAGPRSTRCSIHGARAPTYSAFTVAASTGWASAPLLATPWGRIVTFEVPPAPVTASLDTAQLAAGPELLVGLLGPLPYGPELQVGVGPISWLGFETPANLFVRADLLSLPSEYAQPATHTVLHELAHQWAGDRTTLQSTREVAWKEALAEYLAYRVEETAGAAGTAAATRRSWERGGLFSPVWPAPLDEPEPPLQVMLFNGYAAGPMILALQLEALLGEQAVLDGVAAFLREPGSRGLTDLRTALEGASGQSLETYWRSWVAGEGEPQRPELAVSVVGQTITVAQRQAAAPFPCVVELEVQGGSGSRRTSARFGLEAPPREVQVGNPLSEPVLSVRVDPDHRLLDLPSAP